MPEAEYIPRGQPDRHPGLDQLAALSNLLDRAFRVPGTQWRFGLDALIGLFPGLGDIVGSLVGVYSLWIAQQMGAPGVILARMVLNLVVDGIVGLVPVAGDLFDFAFKAHSRNQALLARWVQSPHTTQRSSWLVLAACALVLLALLAAAIWLFISAVQWIIALLQ